MVLLLLVITRGMLLHGMPKVDEDYLRYVHLIFGTFHMMVLTVHVMSDSSVYKNYPCQILMQIITSPLLKKINMFNHLAL